MHEQDPNEQFSPEEFQRDMDRLVSGRSLDFSRIGLPKHDFDGDGLRFLLAIPVFLVWLAVKDPFHGWNRWRVAGVVLALLTAATMFALMVFTGVQYELGGQFGLAEDSEAFVLLQTIGTGGIAAVIFFLWPRTIILLAVVVGAISAIRHFF